MESPAVESCNGELLLWSPTWSPAMESCSGVCSVFLLWRVLQWGLLQLSPAVESCSGESYSGVLCSEGLSVDSTVESCSGVLQLSPTVDCPAVECPAVESPPMESPTVESCSGVLQWRVL